MHEDILPRIPIELLVRAARKLPDARDARDASQHIGVRLPDGTRAQVTFVRLRRKQRHIIRWFWTPARAVMIPDAASDRLREQTAISELEKNRMRLIMTEIALAQAFIAAAMVTRNPVHSERYKVSAQKAHDVAVKFLAQASQVNQFERDKIEESLANLQRHIDKERQVHKSS